MSELGASVRRLGLRLGAVACLWVAAVLALSSGASAERPTAVGWWHRASGQQGGEEAQRNGSAPSLQLLSATGPAVLAQAPPTTVPPPPVPAPVVPTPEDPPAPPAPVPPPAAVPDGGLLVANDTLGPSAISALRFEVPDVGEATLTLHFAPGATHVPFAIIVCPTLDPVWQSVQNGAWRDRPAHDCERGSALGSLLPEGDGLSWALPAFFRAEGASTLDVVLLPQPGDGSPFSIAFEPPGDDALTVLFPDGSESVAPPAPRPAPPPPSPEDEATATAPFADVPTPPPAAAGPSVAAEAAFSAAEAGEASASTSAPRRDSRGAQRAVRPLAGVEGDDATVRIAAVVALVALAGWLWFVSSNRLGAAALLRTVRLRGVTAAQGSARGVGRFARPRDGPPTRL